MLPASQGSDELLKLPQCVWEKPSHQMQFCCIEFKISAFAKGIDNLFTVGNK